MSRQYFIKKTKKDSMQTIGYLSRSKKKWLPAGSRQPIAQLTEQEANAFIRARDQDPQFYYFKGYHL